jgi:hypothetical protein
MPGSVKPDKTIPPTSGGHDHMNQAQQGTTGIGLPPFTWNAVGSGTHSLTQLTVSVGKSVMYVLVVVGLSSVAPLLVEVVVVPLGSGTPLAAVHGHGGGRMVRDTGVAVMPSMVVLVGEMTNGGGLTLAVGMMMDGTAPSTVVVSTTLEKLMRSVVTGGMEISVLTVTAV